MQVLRLGDAEIDLGNRWIRSPRGDATLTRLESALLQHLLDRRGVTVDRRRLLAEVWGYAPRSVSRAVDHTISRLRRKIERDPTTPRWLVTAKGGGGYRLELASRDLRPLPEEPSSFVGRERELAALRTLLDTERVVVLLGLGGIGKTRLALRLARERSARGERVVMTNFARASTTPEVADRVSAALAVQVDHQLQEVLEANVDLLILDEVEDAPDAALALLLQTPGLRILITSQRPIGPAATFEVGPLDPDDAVALARARCTRPASDADLAILAAALDGIPFAIEVASPWLALAPAAEVVPRLDAMKQARVAGKHATLQLALSRSWELLDDAARTLLADAAVFEETFSVTDLAGLTGRADVVPVATELLSCGWLHRAGDRLRLYTVVRQFLVDLGAIGIDGPNRLAGWLVSWAPAARRSLLQRWDPATDARLVAMELELRSAVAGCDDPELAAQLVPVLQRSHRSRSDGALRELDALATRLPPRSPYGSELHLKRAAMHEGAGRWEAARSALRDAERCLVYAGASSRELGAHVEGLEGRVRGMKGEPDADVLLRRAIAEFDALGDRYQAQSLRVSLGTFVGHRDSVEGVKILHDALADAVAVGAPHAIARVHFALVFLYRKHDDMVQADLHEERAVELARVDSQGSLLSALVLNYRGSRLLDLGELDRAEALLRESLDLHLRHGNRRGRGSNLIHLAKLELLRRRPVQALELLTSAEKDLVDILQARSTLLVGFGMVLLSLDRWAAAIESLEAAVDATRAVDADPEAWAGLALAWLGAGDRDRATAAAANVQGPIAAILADAFAADPKFARPVFPGGEILMLAVEHVWGRTRESAPLARMERKA